MGITYAIRLPSGLSEPCEARGTGRASSGPPSIDTVHGLVCPAGADARFETKTTRRLSGVQPMTLLPEGCQVSRLGSPPSTGTRYTDSVPAYFPEKATHRPSGDNFGSAVSPWKLVSRRASPPVRSTIQMLLA